MNQIAKREDQPAAPVTDNAAVISMLERASRDPSVDIVKMRELMAMRKELISEQAEMAFNAAMSAVQADMRPIAADANNPQTRSRYASYLALDKAMRPLYTRHGFALSFSTEPGATPDILMVICDVSHRDGRSRRYSIPMPADGKGAKGGDVMTKTHATGAAMTYGQRYLMKMIFNIAVGEDNDQGGESYARITQKQADDIHDLLQANGKPLSAFLKWAKVERVEDLRADYYDSAVNAIKASAK